MAKLLGVSILFGWIVLAPPCLWDYETLQMERARFPSTNELIAGKFRRHSPEYYQWRIQDREKKLETDPENQSLLDDLAVSYEKTGNTDKAIELMHRKATIRPGLYETHANLGTFYVHNGEYEKGLVEIKAAIAINPEAHFGREIYQQMLVEYLLVKRAESADGKITLPLEKNIWQGQEKPTGFAKHVLSVKNNLDQNGYIANEPDGEKEIENATKGILGMMRFGNFDHPVLLEALSDLLLTPSDPSRRLAVRALLKASYESDDEAVATAYFEKAEKAFAMQALRQNSSKAIPLSEIEKTFKQELADGKAWFDQICKDEKAWIAAGVDVEAEYAKKYFTAPQFSIPRVALGSSRFLIVSVMLVLIALFLVYRISNRSRSFA